MSLESQRKTVCLKSPYSESFSEPQPQAQLSMMIPKFHFKISFGTSIEN